MRVAKLPEIAVAVGLVSVVFAAGCGDDDSTSEASGGESIKIAAPMELSGSTADAGKEYLQYLQFGVDQVNENGGIEALDGAELELLVEDTKSDPAAVPGIIRNMESEGAVANVGTIASAGVVAAKPTLVSLGIPWVGVAAEPSLTSEDSDGTMWRITGNAEEYARGAFDFLAAEQEAGKIDVETIGILTPTVPPSPEYKAAIEKFATENGWSTVAYEYDFTKQVDYNSLIAKLRSEDVDLVMGQSYPPDAIGIAQAIALQDWRPKEGFLWLDGYQPYNDFFNAVSTDVEGWLDASNIAPQSSCEAQNELSKAYEDEYGGPIVSSAGGGVSVIGVIADALERAGSADPADLKEALASSELTFCEGLYGQLGGVEFDATGNNTAFEPTIVQFTEKQGQVAVAPEAAKVEDASWPAN